MAIVGKSVLGLAVFGVVLVTTMGTGCSAEPDDVDEEGAVSDVESSVVDDTLDGCGGECRPSNCVGYARCRTARDNVAGVLPPTGNDFGGKLAVAQYERGHRGCVAMIRTGSTWGHAAYVEDSWVGSDGVRRYRLSEASWEFSYRCNNRSGSKAALNIAEFWCG